MSDTEQVGRLKPQVYEFIESNSPVDHDTIMSAFGGVCDCCGEVNDTGEAIKEARMQLLDENRIVTDLDWNYRARKTTGIDQPGRDSQCMDE